MIKEIIEKLHLEDCGDYYVVCIKAPVAKDNFENEVFFALEEIIRAAANSLSQIGILYMKGE